MAGNQESQQEGRQEGRQRVPSTGGGRVCGVSRRSCLFEYDAEQEEAEEDSSPLFTVTPPHLAYSCNLCTWRTRHDIIEAATVSLTATRPCCYLGPASVQNGWLALRSVPAIPLVLRRVGPRPEDCADRLPGLRRQQRLAVKAPANSTFCVISCRLSIVSSAVALDGCAGVLEAKMKN